MTPMVRKLTTILPTLILAAGVAWTLAMHPVQAGPVSCSPQVTPCPIGSFPYTKVGVYGGVLTVAPGGVGDGLLEIGNGGTDIAGTTDLFLRPGTNGTITNQANSLRTYKAASGKANLYVPGKVCLYASGTEDCRDSWSSGSGTSSWELVPESVPYVGTVNFLQPIPAYALYGVRIGSSGTPLTLSPLVDLGTNAFVNNEGSGYAVKVDGNVTADYSVYVYNNLKINGNIPWGPFSQGGQEGMDSGLDADKVDGVDVKLEPASACTDSNGAFPHVACMCFYFKDSGTGATVKRCADFANRPYP